MARSNVKVANAGLVFITDLETGSRRYFGCVQTTDIEMTMDVEDIRCGIGNRVVSQIKSNKSITLNVTTGLYSEHMIQYQTGNDFEYNQTVNVPTAEVGLTAVDNGGDIQVTLPTGSAPVGGLVQVQDEFGRKYIGTLSTLTVTITADATGENITPTAGSKYTVTWDREVTDASTLDLSVTDFPKNYKVEVETLIFNRREDTVLAKAYWIFDNMSPDGNLSLSQAGATNATTNIVFTAIDNGSDSYGTYIVTEE